MKRKNLPANNDICVVNDQGEFLVNPDATKLSFDYPDACLFSSVPRAVEAAEDARDEFGGAWDVIEFYGLAHEEVIWRVS